MSDSRVVWHEEAVLKAAQQTVVQRMNVAVIVVRDQVKVLVNRGNPTGKDPSAPGEPPKKVSGRFFKSVTSRVIVKENEVVGVVATDVPYQPRLELGFFGTDKRGRVYRQAARPSFRPAMVMTRPTVKRVLGVR